MSKFDNWEKDHLSRVQSALIGHGALVIVIGLIAGLMLAFALVGGIKLWPILDITMDIPGSARGWQAAHTGGLMNGTLMIVVAISLPLIPLTTKQVKWVYWMFISMAWGNTVFYWFGNFSQNRGLSVGATPFGEGDIYGAIAYIVAIIAAVLTIIGAGLLAKKGFSGAKKMS